MAQTTSEMRSLPFSARKPRDPPLVRAQSLGNHMETRALPFEEHSNTDRPTVDASHAVDASVSAPTVDAYVPAPIVELKQLEWTALTR
jgi:hypothetical protein